MENYNVIKRDGSKSTLDIKKIRKHTIPACEGLNNVDYLELELDAKIQFRNNITTREIQETLIKTAVDKIDVDKPDWNFVAARLMLNDLYHTTGKLLNGKKGKAYSQHLRDVIKYGVKEEVLHPVLLSKRFNHDELNDYIKPERDKKLTYLSVKTLADSYLAKNKQGEIFELPQHRFMIVAMFLASNEQDPNYWTKRFYDLISKIEVMVATPTLNNAGKNRHQLSSCYVGSTGDSIEAIFDGYKDMALMSKYGGGLGWDWTSIRSLGSIIDTVKGASGGLIPWMKITNDIMISVDQLGARSGSEAVYVEPWHKDIMDFLDLRKNSGEERRRAHDLFPALWIPDLFMKRVEANEHWTLFDPHEVPDLHELYGEEFEKRYMEYENDPNISKEVVNAKELWKKILLEYYETGTPFITFKDEHNRRNMNKHTGIIRSSNLCTEISGVSAAPTYKVEVLTKEGYRFYLDPEEDVKTYVDDLVIIKKAKRLTAVDIFEHTITLEDGITVTEKYGIEMVKKVKVDNGRTFVCNLASINLAKVNTIEKIEEVIPVAIRMLDNVIDLNYYPNDSTRETNKKTRALGLGVMGEAQMLAEHQIMFGTLDHFNKIDEIMEAIHYNAIKASVNLAKEKGSYPEFEGSSWSRGELIIDTQNEEAKKLTTRPWHYDWEQLREEVKTGMRNGYLMAIAPTGRISIIAGTTASIEPVYKRLFYEENKSGLIPNIAPNLSPDTFMYYVQAYDLDQRLLVQAAAIRQKWVDQAQSLNIFVHPDRVSGRVLNDIYMLGWKLGVKSFYYLRSQSPEVEKKVDTNKYVECVGCQ